MLLVWRILFARAEFAPEAETLHGHSNVVVVVNVPTDNLTIRFGLRKSLLGKYVVDELNGAGPTVSQRWVTKCFSWSAALTWLR